MIKTGGVIINISAWLHAVAL
jgi:2,4-dienoyl-CoA reductase [(3E)-enoyl-CoA-producing], peroxisomal